MQVLWAGAQVVWPINFADQMPYAVVHREPAVIFLHEPFFNQLTDARLASRGFALKSAIKRSIR